MAIILAKVYDWQGKHDLAKPYIEEAIRIVKLNWPDRWMEIKPHFVAHMTKYHSELLKKAKKK